MFVGRVQSGIGSLWYQSAIYASRHAATTAPVEPVTKAPAVEQGSKTRLYAPALQPARSQLPEIRLGADPAEMAVRSRIRYLNEDEVNGLLKNLFDAKGDKAKNLTAADKTKKLMPDDKAKDLKAGDKAKNLTAEDDDKNKSPAEMMEEEECQTCERRKYQDGSNDPGVSFKTPTKLSPEQAATAVRSHEMEHVVREQAKAAREDRKVVQQSVTLHNEICPECGEVYVSGGETRTVTKADSAQPIQAQQPQQYQQNEQSQQSAVPGFEAVA